MSNWSLNQNEGGLDSVVYTGLDTNQRTRVLTRPSAAFTKGAWTTLNESMPACIGFFVTVYVGQNDTFNGLFDIAIGGAGNEVAIVQNLGSGLTSFRGHSLNNLYIPIQVAAGQRLSMRYSVAQNPATIPGDAVYVSVVPQLSSFLAPVGLSYCDTFGANESTIQGTTVTNSYFSKTNLVEYVANTEREYRGLLVTSPRLYNSANNSLNVWVGGAGSETAYVWQYQVNSSFSGDPHGTQQVLPVNIPSGSRICLNVQGNGVNTNNIILHLFG